MNLIKEHWTQKDVENFKTYLLSFSKGAEKGLWEQRIINTKLPCIAVPSPVVKDITKEISKGNFIQFLDFWVWDNFTHTSVNGGLICKIKDFVVMKKYLLEYANKIDNWASCDLLKFKITPKNKELYYNLSQECIMSSKPFVRRLGVKILFNFIADNNYIDKIFNILNSFEMETEYYVNMINAWIFAECFTKQREKTIKFLDSHKLNKFTINKGIQKCRDSFRVSKEDKEMLLKYKVK
ncbi:MAG: DNA alkylation repair protein [Clostridia bacterium]|nr:DNA alkylation repair protein [Clostridia bacterium]